MPSSPSCISRRVVSSIKTASEARPPALHRLLSRANLIVAAALLLAAALAWAWLLSVGGTDSTAMAGMAMPIAPWTAGYLLPTFAMWSIMMVAMMVPSAAPMILLHARIDRTQSANRRLLHSLIFILAYLLVWTTFAAGATAAQALLIATGRMNAATLAIGDRAAAALLIAAAVYEMTAAKRLCLEKCQAPLLFVLRYWRPGAMGALNLGVIHGLFCVGCCWALMLLLFVGGVMNLIFVAGLGVIVLGEKIAPARWHANRWIAAILTAVSAAMLWLG
jgi:predicted metal-binding membrane protein